MVSEASLQQVQGYPVVKQFYMTEKDPYPCRVNVHMALGEENFGNLAILYYYDENSDSLRPEDSFRITADGHAIFGLNRGDEYVVTVMKGYRVASGDTLSHIAVRHGLTLNALRTANPEIHNPGGPDGQYSQSMNVAQRHPCRTFCKDVFLRMGRAGVVERDTLFGVL